MQRSRILTSLLFSLVFGLAGGLRAEEADVPVGWWDEVHAQIGAAEYGVTWQEKTRLDDVAAAWHAPNRAQDFRVYFTPNGVRVVPRSHEERSWEWGLELVGYGRERDSVPHGPAQLVPLDNRMDYDRGSSLEWFVNEPQGLKHGFTLLVRPDRTPTEVDDPIHVDLALRGGLIPRFSSDGQSIDFAIPGGAVVLRYSALEVTDARDRRLPSHMEGFWDADARGVRVVIDDRNAFYPLTVDPLATSATWSKGGDQPTADFGLAVATAGDVNGDGYSDVIVGARRYDNGETDEGAAWVFHGSPAGPASVHAWMAESDQAGAYFGFRAVAAGDVNGDGYSDVIVGAHRHDSVGSDDGSAFVYHGSPMGLSSEPDWVGEAFESGANFGYDVATAGDVNGDGYSDVIVGARHFDGGPTIGGAAFAYHGSASGLSTTADWMVAEADQASAQFGYTVATAGDVNGDGFADVLVTAPLWDGIEGIAKNHGRIYLYYGSASGLSDTADWSYYGDIESQLGISAATAGDVNGDGHADFIVGSYLDVATYPNEGKVEVFHGSPTNPSVAWSRQGGQENARLGVSVHTAGDVNGDGYGDVIVGAYLEDNGHTDEGRAYVFTGSSDGLGSTPAWTGESNQSGGSYGRCVATAGDVNGDGYSDVIVGAYRYDDGETDEGTAYIYLGGASGLSGSGWQVEAGGQTGGDFGASVATAGDVDADGFADVIVGAPQYDTGETDAGRAFIFRGSETGISKSPDHILEIGQVEAHFGWSVASAGDVNGDGYGDVIVGAPDWSDGEVDGGGVFVFLGGSSSVGPSHSWSMASDQAGADLGKSVATAGDVNGDGYSDVIVGAPAFDYGTKSSVGKAWVFHGSDSGLSTAPAWARHGDQSGMTFGASVSTAGDMNGDGFSDIVVGAPGFEDGQPDEGQIHVFHGSSGGLFLSPAWTFESDNNSAELGFCVSTAGDVNGDGLSEVIAGAPTYSNGESTEGAVFLFDSTSSLIWVQEGGGNYDRFGYSVSTAGDVNGDGYADIVASGRDIPDEEFRVDLYLGSPAGVYLAWSRSDDAYFGYAVSAAGDVNGDGYADILVGSPKWTGAQVEEGRMYVYFGNGGTGRTVKPRQFQVDANKVIAPLGLTDAASSFRLNALGSTPFGRGRIKLEWEAKPHGTPFDGTGTGISAEWKDAIGAWAWMIENVEGLGENTMHHWRARLRYDPVTTPFLPAGRWFTQPWNGWQEADLRTPVVFPAGGVSGLTVAKSFGVELQLSWDSSCFWADTDYAIFSGDLGSFDSHTPLVCSNGGDTSIDFDMPTGDRYFLVVSRNTTREGSYGTDSEGVQREPSASSCRPQEIYCSP